MGKIAAVIFDMDGVIIDSEPIHYWVNQRLFKELGLDINNQEYSEFIGCSNNDMWRILKGRYNLQESIAELINHQLEENIKYLDHNKEKPITGILDLLEKLKANNFKIALASSSPMKYIARVLEEFAIEEYFGIKVSGEELARSKPNPDIYIKAARLLDEPVQKCIVIEDSYHGVTAAKKAGMKCIGFKNTNSGKQDISEADLIVDSIEDINPVRF